LGDVTPDYLRRLYNIGTYQNQNPKNSLACGQFLEQYMDPNDLQTFFQQIEPSLQGQTATIVGPNDPTQPGDEASLDIEYLMGVGQLVPATFWYTAGRAPNNTQNEPFLQWLIDVGNDQTAPWLFSVSYGDDEDTVDEGYAVRIGVEFQKAGVRGISILFASGDGGVAGSQGDACTVFIPTFPASCPWVTGVGGTMQDTPEVAAYFSGGGFANYFAAPDYQTAAVNQYFSVAQNLPPATDYNRTGRAFPDVSAQSVGFDIVVGGSLEPVDGTSCAAPTFSSVVALLNDVRLQAGKSTLGFLNPLIYKLAVSNPTSFNDVTQGSNPGCGTNGFQAAAGWDPVTGWGTPNFAVLKPIVEALP